MLGDYHLKYLKEAKPLPTPTELRSSMGFVNSYRRFIRSYTDKARPLYNILRGSPKTVPPLGNEQVGAFKTLVDAVTSPPILSIPERGLRYSTDTDASSYQVGCALFQTLHEGKRLSIWFWPRKMTPAEMN